MVFTFARVGAVVAMRVEDYYPQGKRWWVRLHEKGGKRHEMQAHHTLEAYLDAGGTLEQAQRMAAHESPRTTKLYDRTGDAITLDEVERIRI